MKNRPIFVDGIPDFAACEFCNDVGHLIVRTWINRCQSMRNAYVFFRDCNSSLFSILNDKVVCGFTIFVCYTLKFKTISAAVLLQQVNLMS